MQRGLGWRCSGAASLAGLRPLASRVAWPSRAGRPLLRKRPVVRSGSTTPPSPRVASIHEQSTIATNMPFMAVFNNLVRFDPGKPRNGFDTIVPELADSWAWDASGTKLTVKLHLA